MTYHCQCQPDRFCWSWCKGPKKFPPAKSKALWCAFGCLRKQRGVPANHWYVYGLNRLRAHHLDRHQDTVERMSCSQCFTMISWKTRLLMFDSLWLWSHDLQWSQTIICTYNIYYIYIYIHISTLLRLGLCGLASQIRRSPQSMRRCKAYHLLGSAVDGCLKMSDDMFHHVGSAIACLIIRLDYTSWCQKS